MELKTILIVSVLVLFLLSCKESNKETNEQIIQTETRSIIKTNQNQLDSISENTSSNNFKGGGEEPFWSVEIVDKSLHFQSSDKNYRSITTSIKTVDPSGNTLTFNSENDRETIKLEITEEVCINEISGKKDSHKIELAIKRINEKESKAYKGCGSFINK